MKYIVKSQILHNGRVFKAGEEIELTEKEAKDLQAVLEAQEEQKESKKGGRKE
jgi:hypothetical protein